MDAVDCFPKQWGHRQNCILAVVRLRRHRDGVGDDNFIKMAIGQYLRRVLGEHRVGDATIDFLDALLRQNSCGVDDSAPCVNLIVES